MYSWQQGLFPSLHDDLTTIDNVDACRGVLYGATQEVVVDASGSGCYTVDAGGIELANGDEVPHGG